MLHKARVSVHPVLSFPHREPSCPVDSLWWCKVPSPCGLGGSQKSQVATEHLTGCSCQGTGLPFLFCSNSFKFNYLHVASGYLRKAERNKSWHIMDALRMFVTRMNKPVCHLCYSGKNRGCGTSRLPFESWYHQHLVSMFTLEKESY